MNKLTLISGLPRSGSTLLCNLLNSNPKFHATPTSGVVDVVNNIRNTFSNNVSFRTQNRIELMEDMSNGIKGFLNGYFESKNVVFDKSRGWTNNLQLLDEIFKNKDTKIIWTYRKASEIVNSIERQYQKTIILENVDENQNKQAFSTLDRRIGTYISDGGLINYPIEILIDAIEMGYGDRIFFLSYEDLCKSTQEVLDLIHNFIGEDKYEYNINDLKQSTFEYDGIYNYKFMHNIKEGKVEYSKTKNILPQKYIDIIDNKYANLHNFIVHKDVEGFLGSGFLSPKD